ncbi:MAG: D-alanyl-D-alanine carboxypeptidase/D-alanyl-D-alanine-endopeptidase [Devosiaceae bacterium]
MANTIRALAPGGLVHVVGQDGQTLVSQNADQAFVPASVTKIATAWLGLEVLGADYRFTTSFYVDAARVLYVRGGGDPYLVSEELSVLAQRLVDAAGQAPFNAVVLDTSHFPDGFTIPGVGQSNDPYNALNAALVANFNTINAVRDGDAVRSAEEQTPITPLAIAQVRQRGPNGTSRISLAQQDPRLSALYAGELMAAFIARSGGAVRGGITIGRVPAGLAPIYVHQQSRPLSEIAQGMLAFSNNYIANQIFLQVGAEVLGSPVSLQQSQRVLGDLLVRYGLSNDIAMVEGSGISRQNQMTARGLAALLTHFAPYAGLMESSPRGSRYKTGTLSDVSTLAGYAQTREHGLVRFVIALPGGTGRLRFAILEAIEQGL